MYNNSQWPLSSQLQPRPTASNGPMGSTQTTSSSQYLPLPGYTRFQEQASQGQAQPRFDGLSIANPDPSSFPRQHPRSPVENFYTAATAAATVHHGAPSVVSSYQDSGLFVTSSAAHRRRSTGEPSGTVYEFVSLPGSQQPKRPRRKFEEIERIYNCSFPGCSKAYGTLNHLNAHVTMQRHGPKRTPEEFKETRRLWKLRKKEESRQQQPQQPQQQTTPQSTNKYPNAILPPLPPSPISAHSTSPVTSYFSRTGPPPTLPPTPSAVPMPLYGDMHPYQQQPHYQGNYDNYYTKEEY